MRFTLQKVLLLVLAGLCVAAAEAGLVEGAQAGARVGISKLSKPVPRAQSKTGGVGSQIQKLGEEVADRLDRIIKQKSFDLWGDPWTVQGLPLLFPTSNNGFNLGLYLALRDIRRQDPHKFQLEAEILASDRGRYKHFATIDYPKAFDGRFRISSRVAYDREIALGYFGIGNGTTFDASSFYSQISPYQQVLTSPSLTFQILRYFGRALRLGPTVGLKWTEIGAPPDSLLAAQRPLGIGGGRTHYLGIALVHDTTDFEPYPSRGTTHEIFLNYYPKFFGSNYEFYRGTYTLRTYFPLHRTLTLAHRTFFEALAGQVPYFEMEAVGGANPQFSFGGDKYFRGYQPNHFIDRFRLVFGFEFRWDPINFQFAKQDITVGFVPFLDLGRVWASLWPIDLSDFHASTGWGMRLIWNSRFIMRGDFALNDEGATFVVNLGNSF